MERNNKTLLIAVLIMLLALVSLNFSNISGKVGGSENVIVRVSPSNIRVPDSVNLYVDAAGVSIDSTTHLYRSDGSRASVTNRICKSSFCTGIVSSKYFIDSRIEPGVYFIRVTGSRSKGGSWDSNMFTIV